MKVNLFILFKAVLAEYSRLRYLEKISQRLLELTRAHKGEVIVTVTTVCVSYHLEYYSNIHSFNASCSCSPFIFNEIKLYDYIKLFT